MKITKIKFKILLLLLSISIIFTLLFSIYTPSHTKHFCNKVSAKNAEFIASLFVKNISLSIQNMKSDSVDALEKTLNLIKQTGDNKENRIAEISIFDAEMKFLNGINTDFNQILEYKPVEKFILKNAGDTIKVCLPISDSEKKILGYLYIDFSEHYLNKAMANNSVFSLLIGILVLLTISAVAYFLLNKFMDAPINKLVENIKNLVENIRNIVENNDLTKKVEVDSSDEIGALSNSFNEILKSMNNTFTGINQMSNELDDSVTKMSDSVSVQAEVILQQDESVNNTASAVEELSVTANQIAESAVEVSNQIEISAQKVSLLSEKANQIGKVISTIEYITEKIDNLSLNASIEAARAGEQGKSFAVVASEIRKLAENTSKSTEDIIALIEDIQNSTADAVLSTEQAVDFVKRIELSIQQHNVGTQQADEAMTIINDGMKRTSEGINQIVEVIEDINSRVEKMKEFICDFKINSSE
ncbi:methyl-accepting chemotaxis protein [candidate division KSB1 bacterium]